jgi:branched-chain amino acid transport system permease protein
MELLFFFETVISGLMTGVMYALVALGFVLIFKASGMVNFAQGVMALFAALALYDFVSADGWFYAVFGFSLPVWAGLILTVGVMIILAWLIERLMLQHLV